jgi:hypothetical protein
MLIQLLEGVRYFERVEPESLQLRLAGFVVHGFVTLNGSVVGTCGLKTREFRPAEDDRGKEFFLLTSDLVPPAVRIIDYGDIDHKECGICT